MNDVIVTLGAQAIVNNCVDQPTTNNSSARLFQRYLGPTPGPLGEITGQVPGNTLLQAGVNFAARKRRGIDVNLAYRTNLTDDVRLNTNLIWTHNLQISNFENPALPDFENRVLSELGDPEDEFRWDVDLTYGQFTFGYRMHYIGQMFTSTYENFNALPTACPQATPCTAGQLPPLNLDAIETRQFPAVFYHDLRFEANLNQRVPVLLRRRQRSRHPSAASAFPVPGRPAPPATVALAPPRSTTRSAASSMRASAPASKLRNL